MTYSLVILWSFAKRTRSFSSNIYLEKNNAEHIHYSCKPVIQVDFTPVKPGAVFHTNKTSRKRMLKCVAPPVWPTNTYSSPHAHSQKASEKHIFTDFL